MTEQPTSEPEDTTGDFPAISVSGDFVDRVEIVRSVNLSTVTTVGSYDEKPVLLSFVDWSMTTGEDNEAKLITFENFAYVLSKMAGDYSRICAEVRLLSSGAFGAEEGRMDYVSRSLDETIQALEKAKAHLAA